MSLSFSSWGADYGWSLLHYLNPVCGPNAEDAKKSLDLLFDANGLPVSGGL